MYPVELKGSKVMLREFREGDLDGIMSIVGDERVTATLSFDTRSRDQAAAMLEGILERARYEPRIEYYLAAIIEDYLVGMARLEMSGVKAGKLGFAIAADHWNRGYAKDAARTLVDFGFRTLQLHRISAAIGPGNSASIAIARHLGMSYEGRIRDHVFTNNAWRDSLLYSVLDSEWTYNIRPLPE